MVKINNYLIRIFLFLSLFYLTFYIPMAFTTYSSSWYKFVCNFHNRCERYGLDEADTKIEQLTNYLMHKGDLTDGWTKKEKQHLKEVLVIFDKLFIVAMMSVVYLIIFGRNIKYLSGLARINIAIILCFFIVLPFFKTFWHEIFHSLLFDNELWKNNKLDTSYYIMPTKFFKITVGFIFSIWIGINVLIYLFTKRYIKG